MDVALTGKDGRVISKTQERKSEPLILNVVDGDAMLQIEISELEFRITGDGGSSRKRNWEIELAVPRVNEK